MSKARDLGNLLNTDGDVKSDSLDNVPTPTKASIEALGIDVPAAKLTGTIADARFPSRLSQSKLSQTIAGDRLPDPLPAIDGSNLTGVAPTKATIEALGIELPAANLTGTVANARFPTTLSNVSLASGGVYENLNTISGNTTTTTSSTKNMFLLGQISVNDTYTWTIAGDGVLQII